MQNTLQHFERSYDRFQDLLSNIGGISSIIMTIGYYMNLLISCYISILDTEELIINRDKMNYGDRKSIDRRPTFIKKVNQIDNSSRRQYLTEQSNISSSKKGQLSSLNKRKESLNSPNYIKFDEVEIYNNKKIPYQNKYYYKDNNKILREKNQIINIKISNKSLRKALENNHKKNEEDLHIKRHNFKWFKYIWYLICCKSNDKMIGYWENIRNCLISEENIIQNHLDIYHLLKINGIKKKDIFNI